MNTFIPEDEMQWKLVWGARQLQCTLCIWRWCSYMISYHIILDRVIAEFGLTCKSLQIAYNCLWHFYTQSHDVACRYCFNCPTFHIIINRQWITIFAGCSQYSYWIIILYLHKTSAQHIEAWAKWSIFFRWNISRIEYIFIRLSSLLFPSSFDNNSLLMTSCRTGNKPLFEPEITQQLCASITISMVTPTKTVVGVSSIPILLCGGSTLHHTFNCVLFFLDFSNLICCRMWSS